MKDSDFPDLQDLDLLHLEDYQLMQKRHNRINNNKQERFTPNSNANPSSAQSFTFDLLPCCHSDDFSVPHYEIFGSELGSFLAEDGGGVQVQRSFVRVSSENFLLPEVQTKSLEPSSNPDALQVTTGNTAVQLTAPTNMSPPTTTNNQKRSNKFDSGDPSSKVKDDAGKKKKWSDRESTDNGRVVGVSTTSSEKPATKRMPRKPSDGENAPAGEKLPRHKRPSHINAEQRRRNKIQHCLDQLNDMVPCIVSDQSVHQSNSQKKSKSGITVEAAARCRLLKSKTKELESESDALRAEIKTLYKQIKEYQSKLPESGVSLSIASSSSFSSTSQCIAAISREQRFEDFVHISTLRNWKFWIFGLLIRPLISSYWDSVGESKSTQEFRRLLFLWLNDQCRLSNLRGALVNALLTLSYRTSAVNNASILPVESIRESMKDAGIDSIVPSRPSSR